MKTTNHDIPSQMAENIVPYELKDARRMMGEAFRLKDETSIKILFHSMTLQTVVPEEEELPIDPARDLITYNLVTRQGVVDIAVFHADGSATVIVVRDGTKGRRHVESGLQTLPTLAA